MTAKEIRELSPKFGPGSRQVFAVLEVAAQLAELNEKLGKIIEKCEDEDD